MSTRRTPQTSVVDPNTLNLDPYPGFWPNMDPDPDRSSIKLSILKEKNKNNLREKQFSRQKVRYLYLLRAKMSPKEICSQLSHSMLIYILNLTPFVSILSYFYMCGSGSVFRRRIHKAPEYGSNTDPQHCRKPSTPREMSKEKWLKIGSIPV